MSSIILFTFLSCTSAVLAKGRGGIGGGGSGSRTCYDSNGNVIACPINKTAIIIGVVVGILALIIVAVVVWFFLRRRRLARAAAVTNGTHNSVLPVYRPSIEKVPHDQTNVPAEPAYSAPSGPPPPSNFLPPPGPPPAHA